MRRVHTIFLALALLAGAALTPARASGAEPLFIHLSTDDAHRTAAGLTFGQHQQQDGHPLTIFLSDRGALLAARAHAERYAAPQRLLAELMQQGATVLVVPLSLKHYGVREDELLPGLQLSYRKLSGAALFRPETRVLGW